MRRLSSVMIDEYLCKISFASEPRFILIITNTTLHQLNIPALDVYYGCQLQLTTNSWPTPARHASRHYCAIKIFRIRHKMRSI